MASLKEILVCRDRWSDAIASGESVERLARDACLACRNAVEQLGSQLVGIGYPVSEFLLPVPANLNERVARIERYTGLRLPMVIREFWNTVGGISLVDLKEYKHAAFWERLGISGAHEFCDGVYIDSCDEEWMAYTVDDFDAYAEDGDKESFRFALAPDGYHKDDISGGPPYSVGHDSEWSPTWENFSWTGYRRPNTAVADPTDFVSYLRTAILECAGFPGLFGHPDFERIRLKLIDGLSAF